MASSLATRIVLQRGDITKVAADAIVNAANTSLLGGGGVDGAIHRAAGPELLAECRKLGGCPTGSARITKGYRLPARYVIHCVGPVYHGGRSGEAQLLASCYETALRLAVENGCKTVAFPAISCGVYGYPLAEAARIALQQVASFLQDNQQIEQVVFVLFDERAYQAFDRAYCERFGPKPEMTS
ncbi:MAG TPA: O-acetyl-ADP-ribose deacetylase [Phycisphaerae bacterium]|nr:O-acetyl-ADP-ribose deacetylase [Phycisphaerae bacterium]HRR86708.1 O-acetyl-ADP-ribose deacetylase [Phycisphaerae bacterium]